MSVSPCCVALPYPRASPALRAPFLMFPKRDAFWKIRASALGRGLHSSTSQLNLSRF